MKVLDVTRFDGWGVLVTGGTSGLGAATGTYLAASGAQVVFAGRDAGRGEQVAAGVGTFVRCDVATELDVERAVDQASQAPQGLRLAVACAGTALVEKTLTRSGPHALGSFVEQLETNLIGAFNVLRLSAQAMSLNAPSEDGERGVVVLTSSIGSTEGQSGQVAYAAAKGGINAMVLPAARDLARLGVRVVGIAPGVFDTPLMQVLSPEVRAGIASTVPFPSRLGHPDEFARMVEAVALNPMVNGTVIRLDGALRLAAR